jgi:hypothetical protein
VILTNVASANWSAIESEYHATDLLGQSTRRTMNMVYAWLRKVCDPDHWNTHYAEAFKFDPATQKAMDARRTLTKPAKSGEQATIKLKRRAPAKPVGDAADAGVVID